MSKAGLRLALPIAYTIQDYSLARVMILVTYLLRCKLCHLVEKQSVYRNPMRKRGILNGIPRSRVGLSIIRSSSMANE